MMRLKFLALSVAVLLTGLGAIAQSPAPVVVPAATDSTPAPEIARKDTDDAAITAAIELLQDLKAKNDEMLRKQQAALEALDQLQKDADQIRIFSKRG
jgi:hypothetical protein